MTDYSAYEADADASRPTDDVSLDQLKAMAQEVLNAEADVARCKRDLQRAELSLYDIQCKRLPDVMERKQLPSFSFIDARGTMEMELESNWRVTMPPLKDKQGNEYAGAEEKRKAIMEWFRAIGQGGLITKEGRIPLGLMSDADVLAIFDAIRQIKEGLEPALKEEINQKRLEAQVRRLKKAGKDVHEDIVCTPVRKVSVTIK